MRKIFDEFKQFALKSSFFEIAIGIFIGAGLTPVATSLIKDVVMPFVGYLLGDVDFTNLIYVLREGSPVGPYLTLVDAKKAAAITVNYGAFINTVLSFFMISWIAFWVVRLSNSLKAKELAAVEEVEPTTKECGFCFSTINIAATRCPQCTSELK
jgi:large conductance mechanosensitive channel